jgi:hypothetical protein
MTRFHFSLFSLALSFSRLCGNLARAAVAEPHPALGGIRDCFLANRTAQAGITSADQMQQESEYRCTTKIEHRNEDEPQQSACAFSFVPMSESRDYA